VCMCVCVCFVGETTTFTSLKEQEVKRLSTEANW